MKLTDMINNIYSEKQYHRLFGNQVKTYDLYNCMLYNMKYKKEEIISRIKDYLGLDSEFQIKFDIKEGDSSFSNIGLDSECMIVLPIRIYYEDKELSKGEHLIMHIINGEVSIVVI